MNTENFAPFAPFVLSVGSHSGPRDGMCFLEMASWMSGEGWTDHPSCVCPVIAAAGRVINDAMSDEQRVQLQHYVPLVIGTRDPAAEQRRAKIMMEWTWSEVLPSLQPLADAEGFGDAWRLMLKDRTQAAAWAAARAAAEAAARAAEAAAWAAAAEAARAAEAAARAAEAAARAAARAAAAADFDLSSFLFVLQRMIDAGKHGDREYTEPMLRRAQELHEVMA